MKLFILLLALLFVAGIYLVRRPGSVRNQPADRMRMVITVKNQEPWVEGFVRKLFFFIKNKAALDVVIVDDFSYDRTPDILKRLTGYYPFKFLSAGVSDSDDIKGSTRAEDDLSGTLYFDVRGLKGRDLLNAPLFHHLSHLNEGKSQVLSK